MALETGIQNSTLTLTIIEFSFGDDKALRDELIIFPLLYSFFLVVDALFLVVVFRYLSKNEVEEDEYAAGKTLEVASIVPKGEAPEIEASGDNDDNDAKSDKSDPGSNSTSQPFIVHMASV